MSSNYSIYEKTAGSAVLFCILLIEFVIDPNRLTVNYAFCKL